MNLEKNGLVKWALHQGGIVKPLIVDSTYTKGTGLMNPSVFVDGENILVNIRHTNYTLYHSEGRIFNHHYGPLQYLHPEDDMNLKTQNFLSFLDHDLNTVRCDLIDTSTLDVAPIWHFIGLEDARLFRWNEKLYLCGVRRDDNTTGSGRMQLSEIEISDSSVKEIARHKIPAPDPNTSYCEKNWMPILDHPYHFVKWTNPTEVVRFDITTGKCVTASLDKDAIIPIPKDQRGGSQVIPYKTGYMAITHEVDLYNDPLGRKDGRYRHRCIFWDQNWKVIKVTKEFGFMGGEIEFCAGAALYGEDILISFGFQDNSAYILKMPIDLIESIPS